MSNVLDGLTILRFAHAFSSGGGTERYLDDLDKHLLNRNRMQIIRLYIARESGELAERVEEIGLGKVTHIGLPLPKSESIQSSNDDAEGKVKIKEWIRNNVFYNTLVWKFCTEKVLLNWKIPRKQGQVVGAGEKVAELSKKYPIDLIILHFMGGSDADEIVEVARRRDIPFAVLNHYSNDRFLHLSIRKHALLADGVASVNGIGVPKYLKGRLVNVSDGIDIDFFKREKASRITNESDYPIIFLPARIVRTKGHLDLIKAGKILKRKGILFKIAFAGRADSQQFLEEVKIKIQEVDLGDRVLFLGVLNPEMLRDWYAASAVIGFPTYHHEGLPRILMESQAMKVPPIAYATGGVPEGLVPEKTGFLLKTGDVKGLADKIEILLKNDELREKMGEEGRRFVENRFSLNALAQRHEAFYLSILNRKIG